MLTHDAERLRYSIPEASYMLGLSVATIWRRVKAEELEVTRDGGRTFITRRELERYAGQSTR